MYKLFRTGNSIAFCSISLKPLAIRFATCSFSKTTRSLLRYLLVTYKLLRSYFGGFPSESKPTPIRCRLTYALYCSKFINSYIIIFLLCFDYRGLEVWCITSIWIKLCLKTHPISCIVRNSSFANFFI